MTQSKNEDFERAIYQFQLYVDNYHLASKLAQNRIQRALKHSFTRNYNLKIINIAQNPELAEANKILVTPTLIKVAPLPTKKIIGDLNDREKLLNWLNFC